MTVEEKKKLFAFSLLLNLDSLSASMFNDTFTFNMKVNNYSTLFIFLKFELVMSTEVMLSVSGTHNRPFNY